MITDFSIPKSAKNIVIFVHGFGVRWDSRGMFTDIRESLPSEWGSVLFDFYKVKDAHISITPVTEQIESLRTVIRQTKEKAPTATLHIIAHSKGCIITALLRPKVDGEIILLAPPETFGTKLEKYFQRYPGAKEQGNELIIPRKDGTTTHIPLSFFAEIQAINAEQAMLQLSKQHSIHLLQTTEDEVIGKTEYKTLLQNPRIHITPISADHNFTGKHRAALKDYLSSTLSLSDHQ